MEFDIEIKGVRLAVEVVITFDGYIDDLRVYAEDSEVELTAVLNENILEDITEAIWQRADR